MEQFLWLLLILSLFAFVLYGLRYTRNARWLFGSLGLIYYSIRDTIPITPTVLLAYRQHHEEIQLAGIKLITSIFFLLCLTCGIFALLHHAWASSRAEDLLFLGNAFVYLVLSLMYLMHHVMLTSESSTR